MIGIVWITNYKREHISLGTYRGDTKSANMITVHIVKTWSGVVWCEDMVMRKLVWYDTVC